MIRTEEERARLDKAREVFQTALEFFGDDEEQVEKAQAVFSAFAKMETRLKEYERARVIYKVCQTAINFMLPTHFPRSLPCRNSLEQNPALFMQLTPSLRNNMVLVQLSKILSSVNVESSTRMNLLMMVETMTYGSIILVWRRVP